MNKITPFEYVMASFKNKKLSEIQIKQMPAYIVMKFLSYSSNTKYPAIQLCNILNKFVFYWDNEMIYNFLCTITPSNTRFYMSKMYKSKKNNISKKNMKLVTILVYHYEVSENDALQMIELLQEEEITFLLNKYKFLFNNNNVK